MKILLFIDSLGAGGAQRQLVGLARMLKEDGEQVKVITYHDAPFYLSSLKENEVDYENVKKARNKYLRLYYIYETIKQYRPDWVIAYLDTPCILACLCKLLGGDFKLIVSERNTTQYLTKRERFKFLLYRAANEIVPNSYSQESFILKNHLCSRNKIKTITNFVDTNYFKIERVRVRKPLKNIVVVATIRSHKNTLGFIDAIKLLRDSGESFVVDWYGKSAEADAAYLEICQKKIVEYQLESCIRLREKSTQIKDVYLEADYFCLPSFYEGTPNALCEAISCGLPVICSDVCDNSLYVRINENGFLFDPHSIQDIKEKLLHALAIDDETYTNYCRKSRLLAEKMLSEDNFYMQYHSLLYGM